MKILIADGSRVMRQIVSRTLRQAGFSGHDVVEAADGRQALEAVSAEEPDLVLSDWNMPEMNGLEFVTAVRADQRLRSMTLMMVTTESEQSQIVRALAAGAHEYVIKPFPPEAIREKLALLGLVLAA